MIDNSTKPVVLVTGAGRGIGTAIASRLSTEGYAVIVADVDGSTAAQVADEIGGHPVALDVTDADAVKAFADTQPRLDALVNNAGLYPIAATDTVDPDTFRRVMDVNVLGPLILTQAFLDHLTRAEDAAVVNVASIAATTPTAGMGPYSPSKAALVSLTQVCAVEFADRGIRFNAIGPGGVRTQGTVDTGTMPAEEAAEERYRSLVPSRRRALAEDIADVVPFLLGRDARYVNGQFFAVDGGLSLGTLGYLRAAQETTLWPTEPRGRRS